MIPIIVGPQGPGYTDIYIDSENNIVQVTTPPITGVNIGKLICYTGATGFTGEIGPSNPNTGPSGTLQITGPTGISLNAMLYNPNECQFRFIYNNDTYIDSDPLECKQIPIGKTGATGPTGAGVDYIILYCGSGPKIQTVYSNGSSIFAGICCICPSLTGYTGPTGIISEYGATGPSGVNGLISQYGATGPTGPSSTPNLSINVNITSPQGPMGPFNYNDLAHIELYEPIQFIVSSNDSIKRKYVGVNQRTEILFPHTPLNINWITDSTDADFTALVDGLLVNNDVLVRIRTEWTSNNIYYKPFGVINYTSDDIFPTLTSTSFPNISTVDDMICMLHAGDVIQIFPGTYSKYPVSVNQIYNMSFNNIKLTITTIYNY
jgi:hypothetical protein